jgi:cupin superfamily acireductone dioxygenase involved in methionine salvage
VGVIESGYMQAMRLFVGDPVWTPINRCENAEEHASRARYVKLVEDLKSTRELVEA